MFSNDYNERIASSLEQVRESGRWGMRRILTSATGPHASLDGRKTIVITTNNYLNLADNATLKQAAAAALEKYGGGQAAGPRICGITDLHIEFEQYLARFFCQERALLFNSCYYANISVLPALAKKGGRNSQR